MKVGFYYKQMIQYVSNVLAPANLTKIFPHLTHSTYEISGFGWVQGWNDGCGVQCTDEYESNMVNLIHDLRKVHRSYTFILSAHHSVSILVS